MLFISNPIQLRACGKKQAKSSTLAQPALYVYKREHLWRRSAVISSILLVLRPGPKRQTTARSASLESWTRAKYTASNALTRLPQPWLNRCTRWVPESTWEGVLPVEWSFEWDWLQITTRLGIKYYRAFPDYFLRVDGDWQWPTWLKVGLSEINRDKYKISWSMLIC